MAELHPYILQLIRSIGLEEKAQQERYRLNETHSLKALKAEGLALHPIRVTGKNYGFADYPEISFRLLFPQETSAFRSGAAIECFTAGEEPVKGMLMQLEGLSGELRLFAPDFPDWIEDDQTGIKLAPDQHTTEVMLSALKAIPANPRMLNLFERLHQENTTNSISREVVLTPTLLPFADPALNTSQCKAVSAILANREIAVVHGPPGTGKTTTISTAVKALVLEGKKVLVCAPGNAAVDHLAKKLMDTGINVLRTGNTGKVDEAVYCRTPEALLAGNRSMREIKQLKIRAEEFRKMATKYKRQFGREEREQKQLLLKEVRAIRAEIKKIKAYEEDKLYREADVIAGTPVGLADAGIRNLNFDTLIIDEAGQCLEPLAWCVFPLAERIVLAGDHWQLPPTVISQDAAREGLNRSILETATAVLPEIHLLDTQYRMKPSIAGFSSGYFYGGLLKTAEQISNSGLHLLFIDTAGSGFEEKHLPDEAGIENEGELQTILKIIGEENEPPERLAFISPYAAQVSAARKLLPGEMRISTIDSFQGQEHPVILLSLVRSNDEGQIGFLKDYRRMNVAITRAKEKLIVIGDSATVGTDPFFNAFIGYVEQHGIYKSVWEYAE